MASDAFYRTPWLEDQRDADGFLVIGGVLISYKGPGGDIRVPDGVTVIGAGSMNERGMMWEHDETLTSVVIPPSVRTIETRAFWGCTKLTSVELSEGLTSIQYGAFGACESLTSIKLPSTLTYLGNSVFDGAGLTSLDIPAGVDKIGGGAFSGCPLTSVTIPAGVSAIEYSAFEGCGSLASVSLPEELQTIEVNAFDGTALTGVTIPESVTSVGMLWCGGNWYDRDDYTGMGAFNGCSALTSVTILNKDCVVSLVEDDTSDPLHTHATIRGHAGSTASTYAKGHGYTFVSIDLPAGWDMSEDGKTDLTDVALLFERFCDLSTGGTAAVPDLCEDERSDLKDITAFYQIVTLSNN